MKNNKLTEKKNLLNVIESIMNNMEWCLEDKQRDVERWEEEKKAAKEEGREPDTWTQNAAENAAAFLKAWSEVEKHLEKLI